MFYVLNSTTNPVKLLAVKCSLGTPLLYREPPKEHLTAKGFRGFVVEFNTYNIPAVESPVTYPFLAGRTSIGLVEAAASTNTRALPM